MKRTLLLACLLLTLLPACIPASDCTLAGADCTRVLFVGNSYTYVNDLPGMFAKLAASGGHAVQTGMAAQGGWFLADHAKAPDTLGRIDSGQWDYVVLQEQSEIPASPQARAAQMAPAARLLVARIRQSGAAPLFFMTWAHRDGWPENNLTYESMEYQLEQGYLRLGGELGVWVVPVGAAWWTVHQADPQLELWQADGSHPSPAGTYLTACVFYAVLFHQSPEGVAYRAGLSKELALSLQRAAFSTAEMYK